MEQLPTLPTPDLIANNLQSIAGLIDEIREAAVAAESDQQADLAKKMLRRAAANVRLLFELQADPETGEFRLQNYGQAWMLADLLIGADMVPSSYETDFRDGRGKVVDPAKVVIGLMKATEIGVSPISGLANIMIINNRPNVWGDLAQALVQRTGVVEDHFKEEVGAKPKPGTELTQWDRAFGWRVGFKRKGQDAFYVGEYTVAHAIRAKLWGNANKKPWITDPERMLFNRARAFALRDGFADCLFGMGIVEEQMDFQDAAPAALPAPAATPAEDDEPVTHEQIEHQVEGENMPDYGERPEPVAVETPDEREGKLV